MHYPRLIRGEITSQEKVRLLSAITSPGSQPTLLMLNPLSLPSLSRNFQMIHQHLQPKTCQVVCQLQLASTRSKKLDNINSIEECHLPLYLLYLSLAAKFQDLVPLFPKPLLLARHPSEYLSCSSPYFPTFRESAEGD